MKIIVPSIRNSPASQRKHTVQTPYPPKVLESPELTENYLRFLPGANAFIAVPNLFWANFLNIFKLFQVYETIRISYLHYMHKDECNQASSLWLASVILNLMWIFVALIGISAINSRRTQRVNKYKILLFLVGISRMLFYLGMYIMKKSTFNNNDLFCSSIYKDEIYLLSTILEGAVISILIFLIHTVKGYIKGMK